MTLVAKGQGTASGNRFDKPNASRLAIVCERQHSPLSGWACGKGSSFCFFMLPSRWRNHRHANLGGLAVRRVRASEGHSANPCVPTSMAPAGRQARDHRGNVPPGGATLLLL